MCLCEDTLPVYRFLQRPEGGVDALELVLVIFVSRLMWVLGNQLTFSGRPHALINGSFLQLFRVSVFWVGLVFIVCFALHLLIHHVSG